MEVPWRDIKVSSGEPRHTITVSTPVLAYCYVTASPKYRARAFPPRSSFMTCPLTATLVLPLFPYPVGSFEYLPVHIEPYRSLHVGIILFPTHARRPTRASSRSRSSFATLVRANLSRTRESSTRRASRFFFSLSSLAEHEYYDIR